VAVSFPGTRMSSNLRAVNIVGLPLRSFILEQKLETAFEKKGKFEKKISLYNIFP